MGIFNKIFGGAKPMTGDAAVVSAILQSISAGADPATQVAKVRAIMGDAKDDTFTGYLDELAGCKGEETKTIARAVDIVDRYYQDHFGDECSTAKIGDEKDKEVKVEKEDKDGKEEKNVEVKKDGKETKDIEVKKEDGKKEVTVKEAGDAIDYDRIINGVVEKLRPAKEEPKVNGDALAALAPVINGDSADKKITSDSIMDAIY